VLDARRRRANKENAKMNWEEAAGDWQRLGPLLKAKWGKLSDEDLASPSEKRELLVEALERHYGIQKKHAELQLDRWVSALKPAGAKPAPAPAPAAPTGKGS
jgi:uncharacterized protein YjbJ (UPF0337 family)